MRKILFNHIRSWLIISLPVVSLSACQNIGRPTPSPVEVTRLVPITQIVVPQVVEVTRIVPATPFEVTRLVPVTPNAPPGALKVTQIVYVTQVVPVMRVATEAPVMIEPTPPTHPVDEGPAQRESPLPAMALANQDMLVRYDFEGDFPSSGKVQDRSGNGFDAQVIGSVGIDNGVSGSQAIAFSGAGYLQAQVNPAGGRYPVSFSLWFKTDHPEVDYKFASAAWWSGGPGSGWVLATYMPEFWCDDMNSLFLPDLVNNGNNFPVGEWVHEVVTYDGSHIREYTDGILVNDWPTTGAPLGVGQAMVVGAWPSNGFYFEGSIDEFQVFGWSLTEQEVRSLYDQGR